MIGSQIKLNPQQLSLVSNTFVPIRISLPLVMAFQETVRMQPRTQFQIVLTVRYQALSKQDDLACMSHMIIIKLVSELNETKVSK